MSFQGGSGNPVLTQSCEEAQPGDSPYKPVFRDASGLSDAGGSWADGDWFKQLLEGGDESTVPCVFSEVLGGSKVPASILVEGAGGGSVRVTTRTTTSERSVNQQTSYESDSRFSLLGLSVGSKKSSSSESDEGSRATVDEQVVTTTGEVLSSVLKQPMKSVCDVDTGLCTYGVPASVASSRFRRDVLGLPVIGPMLKLAKDDMESQAKLIGGNKTAGVAPSSMLKVMPKGLTQVYLEFLTQYGPEVKVSSVLGVKTVITSTKHTSEKTSSQLSSSSSSTTAEFEAFRPDELGATGNKITTHTVVTTEDGMGGSKVVDKTKVVSPPDPPSTDDDQSDQEALKQATGAAAKLAADALAPGSGAAAELVVEKAADVLAILGKAKIQFEAARSQS